MSGTLRVALDPGPIERARADVAFVGFFREERPLSGSAGSVDWRLCGRLSQLVAAGHLAGERGEAALLPTRGGMRAPLLIVLGLGAAGELDDEALARELVGRARALAVAAVACPFPFAEPPARVGSGSEAAAPRPLSGRARALLAGAADALADAEGELALRLVAPAYDGGSAAAALRSARPQLPRSVVLRLPESPARTPTPGLRAAY